MWEFLSAVFNKIASVAVTILVAVGLVSASLPPASEILVSETSSQGIVQEMALSQPEKADKPAVSVAAHSASPSAMSSGPNGGLRPQYEPSRVP